MHIRRKEILTAQDVLLILNQSSNISLDRGMALVELVNQQPQLLGEYTADGRLLSVILRESPWLPRVQKCPPNYPDFMQWYDGMNICKPSSMLPCSISMLVGATVPVFEEGLISSQVQSMYEMLERVN